MRPLGAVLAPWRCAGTLRSGRPCEKLLAEVDPVRPMYVRVVCGRCGHENTLVETFQSPTAGVTESDVNPPGGNNPPVPC